MENFLNPLFIFGAKYLFILSFIIAGVYFLKQSWESKKKIVLLGLISVIIIYAIAFIAGQLYNDPRPFVIEHFTPLIPHDPDNGFPSDHVLMVSAITAVVYFFNRKISFILLGISILVAISRVYVGVHHPIDVIASVVFSFVGASITYTFLKYVQSKKI
ncbi:MAG: phosphatase family protein [Candidatus Taylorbacteria bacterium]|nr:phosphatase family protein [Candidatus Taylorbacteria bacterium]